MAHRCKANGLLLAGFIVTLIGLGIVLTEAVQLPRSWMTAVVGVALLAAGAVRRALRSPDGS